PVFFHVRKKLGDRREAPAVQRRIWRERAASPGRGQAQDALDLLAAQVEGWRNFVRAAPPKVHKENDDVADVLSRRVAFPGPRAEHGFVKDVSPRDLQGRRT